MVQQNWKKQKIKKKHQTMTLKIQSKTTNEYTNYMSVFRNIRTYMPF